MPRKCKCGGTMYRVWETKSAFCFRCNKCRKRVIQHKRAAK